MILVTFETWAYIHAQLDYPPSKRRKLHILNAEGTHTLCGRRAIGIESSEEEFESLDDIKIVDYPLCKRCRDIYEPPRPKTKEVGNVNAELRNMRRLVKLLAELNKELNKELEKINPK